MLAFYGHISNNRIPEFKSLPSFKGTISDCGTYEIFSYKTDNTYLVFSDIIKHTSFPSINEEADVLALSTGHIYEWYDGSQNSSDKELSSEVLTRYLKYGISSLRTCKGHYSIAIIDLRFKPMPKVFLLKDRLGFSPLYCYSDSNGISFSSRPESIGTSGLHYSPVLNTDALAQAFYYGFVFKNNSFFLDVSDITGGQLYTYQNGVFSIIKNGPEVDWPSSSARHYSECIDLIAEGSKSAIKRFCSYCKHPIEILLSGGADSRLLLNCLLYYNYEFKAISEFHFDLDEPDVSTAKSLSEYAGFDLIIRQSKELNQEVTSNMLGKICCNDNIPTHTIKGLGSIPNAFFPRERRNLSLSLKAFKTINPFTPHFYSKLSQHIDQMSDNCISRRHEKNDDQKLVAHNYSNLLGTFLRSSETDMHACPQNRFLGTMHLPYLDEDVIIAMSRLPDMLPSIKNKFFTKMFDRHFPGYPKVPLVHKFISKKYQALTSKVGDYGKNRRCKMSLHDDQLDKEYETYARDILFKPSNNLLGTVISDKCLEAPFFPKHFSLTIIFWHAWAERYFPSFSL